MASLLKKTLYVPSLYEIRHASDWRLIESSRYHRRVGSGSCKEGLRGGGMGCEYKDVRAEGERVHIMECFLHPYDAGLELGPRFGLSILGNALKSAFISGDICPTSGVHCVFFVCRSTPDIRGM